MMLPKTIEAVDQVIRSSVTAGELATHGEMFEAFIRRGSRVAGVRIKGHSRPTIGGIHKDFLAWEKDSAKRASLLRLRFALVVAVELAPETAIDGSFWETVEARIENFRKSL
jgi:hypothetical protein